MGDGRVLYLSGGGLRAALVAVGCVGFLAMNSPPSRSEYWDQVDGNDESERSYWDLVDQVVCVSGGSFLGASLAADAMRRPGAQWESGDVLRALAGYTTRMTSRRVKPLGSMGGIVVGLALASALAVTLGAVIWVGAGSRAWLALIAGVLTLPVVLTLVRGYLAVHLWRLARLAIGSVPRDRASTGSCQFIICAAGLSSARPAYFTWIPASHQLELRTGTLVGHSVIKALRASISVPFSASVSGSGASGSWEILCDPGWGGKFGEQWRLGAFDEERSALSASSWALDAGTHERPVGVMTGVFGGFSMINRLSRWLAISNEAAYENDLRDLERRGLIRACEKFDEPMSAMQRLTSRAAEVSNLGFAAKDAALAVAAGYVATAALVREATPGDDEASTKLYADELRAFGAQLDSNREISEGNITNWSVALEEVWESVAGIAEPASTIERLQS